MGLSPEGFQRGERLAPPRRLRRKQRRREQEKTRSDISARQRQRNSATMFLTGNAPLTSDAPQAQISPTSQVRTFKNKYPRQAGKWYLMSLLVLGGVSDGFNLGGFPIAP